MSKKSFANANPAMSFISDTSEDLNDFTLTSPTKEEIEQREAAQVESTTAVVKPKPKAVTKRKKEAPPMKRNPEYIETKSKRVQMLMQPSLHTAIKAIAGKKRVSLNETMHEILKDYIDNPDNH